MDAHLVGYGSSSDEEGKPKKREIEKEKVSHLFPSERNFRKRSLSPQNDNDLYNPELPSEDNSPQADVLQDKNDQNHKNIRDVAQPSRSRSNSPIPAKLARRLSESPEHKQNVQESGSVSPRPTSEKESRLNVDEFGRQIRHPSTSKEEDGEQRKSPPARDQSKSHEKERRGSQRSDGKQERSREKSRSPKRRGGRSPRRSRDTSPRANRDRSRDKSPGKSRDKSPRRKDRSPRKERSPRRGGDRSPRRGDRSPRRGGDRSPRRGGQRGGQRGSRRGDRSPRRGGDRSPRRSPKRGGDKSPRRSPRRGGDRSPRRSPKRGGRSPRRPSPRKSKSPDRIRDRRDSGRSRDDERKKIYLGGPAKPIPPPKEKEILSSEEVMKRLAQRQESLKHEAQANAATHNLPSYLNPSVVNPQLYAKQQEKRKLLWSSKKKEETPSNNAMWSGTRFTGDQGGEMGAKFRRLMGIKGGESKEDGEEGPSKGDQILTDLEKEFERSRAFQLSRGAGGKSGIGLGYAPAGHQP